MENRGKGKGEGKGNIKEKCLIIDAKWKITRGRAMSMNYVQYIFLIYIPLNSNFQKFKP